MFETSFQQHTGKNFIMTLNSMPHRRHNPSEQATEEAAAENGGMGLPIEPDEGTALIPDDERVVNVPS